MISVNIDSDINQFVKDAQQMFDYNVPLVINQMVNDVADDVIEQLRERTIPKSWTTRNKTLAKAMTTKIGGRANLRAGRNYVIIGGARGRNGFIAGEGFAARQVTGKRKVPKTSAIGIPQIGPGLRRGTTGSIGPSKKPKARRADPKLMKIKTKTGTQLLVEKRKRPVIKNGKKHAGVTRYVLARHAKGTKRLGRFFPDAYDTALRTYSQRFNARMVAAARRLR